MRLYLITLLAKSLHIVSTGRATSWHQATLLLISPLKELPDWLEELGAKVFALIYIHFHSALNHF